MAREEKWYNNVASVLMGRDHSVTESSEEGSETNNEETEVVKALQDKYDALKDKLLMEVKLLHTVTTEALFTLSGCVC